MVFLASLHFFITCVMTDFNAHGQYIITFHYELTILMNHVTRGISRRDIAHGYDFVWGSMGAPRRRILSLDTHRLMYHHWCPVRLVEKLPIWLESAGHEVL